MNPNSELQKITLEMRRTTYLGMSIKQIRDDLEAHELDRHIPIEAESTGIIPYDKFGNILLHEKDAFPGEYGMLGGAKESNESIEECACREAAEEGGISLKVENIYLWQTVPQETHYPNGDTVFYTMHVFFAPVENWEFRFDNVKNTESFSIKLLNQSQPRPKLRRNHEKLIIEALKNLSKFSTSNRL